MKDIKSIMILAWHSEWIKWANPWAEYNWLKERQLVKVIAEQVERKLKFLLSTIRIYWIGISKEVTLKDKVTRINYLCSKYWYNLNNSLLIEIHCNIWWWTWVEILWFNNYWDFKNFWDALASNISKTTKLNNRGLKNGEKFMIINSTVPLAWIVECGFLDNEQDRQVLIHNINKFSKWIVDWILEYIWFEKENEVTKLQKENKELKDKLKQISQIIAWK